MRGENRQPWALRGRSVRSSLSSIYRNSTAILPWILCSGLLLAGAPAQAGGALPTNGKYAAGQGTIAGSTNGLTINQATSHGIINWQGFSIGAGNSVFFNNGSGSTLNRVVGADISKIDGQLSATGSLYLINPQGIVIGPGGKVVTSGSFVASTRDISNSAFMSGGAMSANGTSNGNVVNAGAITSANGDAILVGRSVSNSGTISAPKGTAALAAGNQILLQPVGSDPRIAVSGGTGDVTNSGTIAAAQAQLSSAGGNVYAIAGNNGGLVSATGTQTINGHVWLTAGGTTNISGTVSATNADGSGGTITARGTDINVSGKIDASASQARQAGGTVSVIATGTTTVSGTIKAEGGQGGTGGYVETSGEHLHVADSANISTTAPGGTSGTWLLDPQDFTIGIDISGATLSSELGGSDITISSNSGATAGNGDIFDYDVVSWTSTHTLTLNAVRNIDIIVPITATNGGLTLNAGGTISASSAISVGQFTLQSGAWSQIAASLPSFSATSFTIGGGSFLRATGGDGSSGNPYQIADVYGLQGVASSSTLALDSFVLANNIDASGTSSWNSGAGFAPIGNNFGFDGTFEGSGHTISNLTINLPSVGFVGLFGELGGTIRDIGLIGGSVRGGGNFVGALVGVNSGTINNSYAATAVSGSAGSAYVGGLVGDNLGGTITNSYATGTVSGGAGSQYVGGLAGQNDVGGTISDSYATGSVSGSSYVGGFVGQNFANGAIDQSYETGAVSGGSNVGSFAGYNWGTLGSTTGDHFSGTANGVASGTGVGGGPGFSQVFGGAFDALQTASNFTGWTFGTTGGASGWVIVDQDGSLNNAGGAAGGTTPMLLSEYSTTIQNAHQLQLINLAPAASYTLGADIDASRTAGGDVWGSQGFVPIGDYSPFQGTFEGNDHIISNLTINLPSAGPAGLFGQSNGTIRDVGLVGGSVLGSNFVGALVGYNAGTVNNSYATGAVSGFSTVGGLVGYNQQTITNSYATGAVSGSAGSSGIGGLAGWNFTGTISGSYATGAVSGSSQLGGLVGTNLAGTITNSYWDTQTSGQPVSGGGSGLTTAQLQGTLPTGFNSAVWGTGSGLYPYLKSFYSGTPQAITGTAYSNGGGTFLSGGTISALVNGTNLGSSGTGANGYYYLLAPSGTISSNAAVLVYTSGANAGAHIEAMPAGSIAGFDVWGNTLIAPTSATTYSSANSTSLQTQDAALIAQAIGHNTDPTLGITNYGYLASGNFTIDTPLTLSNGLYVRSQGNITVGDALTLSGTNALNLNAAGSLAIDAPIHVTGAGKIALDAAYDTTTVPGASLLELSFARGSSIDYGATNNGGALSINGTPYTLLYSMSDLAGINTNVALGGNYALATSLDATSTSGWAPLGTNAGTVQNGGAGFAGIFDGLGNTISNLTVNTGANNYAGLFGYSSGTIRDVGVVGGSTSGNANIGALVGENHGIIANSYATGGVIGVSTGGGLVGNNANGTIANSYATGSVVVTGFGDGGGLVGAANGGTIINAYATGAVRGDGLLGGLVGFNLGGGISNAYATGAVVGNADLGGLVGDQQGTVSNAYWDTETSGMAAGFGFDSNAQTVTGLTTAQLQGTLPSGLSSSAWGTGAGLYPYFKWQYPTTPQAISGTAYTDAGVTKLNGGSVSLLVDGDAHGTVSSGANGYYYFLLAPGSLNESQALAYTSGGAALGENLSAATSGLDVYSNALNVFTNVTNYSIAGGHLHDALGSGNPTVASFVAGLPNYNVTSSATTFTVDTAPDFSLGNIGIADSATNGQLIVSAPISWSNANQLTLSSAGSLAINAPINVTGAGKVVLDAGLDTTTVPGTSLLEMSFGQGDSLSFTGGSLAGASLSINGTPYTLLYSMGDVQNVKNDLAGNYALAAPLDAATDPTTPASWIPIGTNGSGFLVGSGFHGIFEGLGNTVSNFTVSNSTNNPVGLFGFSNGTIRDVGMVNASITGRSDVGSLVGISNHVVANDYSTGSTGSVAGSTRVGGLIGNGVGAIVNSWSSSSVTGNDPSNSSEILGGLIGQFGGGTVINSHASGNVTAPDGRYMGGLIGQTNVGTTVSNDYATGNVSASIVNSGGFAVGGLIGYSYDAVTDSYATGDVTGEQNVGGLIGSAVSNSVVTRSFATGSVRGDANSIDLGGLIGYNNGVSVSDSYATGAVVGGDQLGGLFGTNIAVATNVYATGFVGPAAGATPMEMGALVGENDDSVANGYWDSETSGQTNPIGLDVGSTTTSQTTALLQHGLPTNFDSTVWGTGSGLYPYLKWQYPTTPQAISGTAYSNGGGTPLVGGRVSALADGASLGSASTGANGYYYILMPGSTITSATGAVLASSNGVNAGTRLDTGSDVLDINGNVSGFDIWGSTLIAPTTRTAYSDASAHFVADNAALIAQAVGSNTDPTAGLTNFGYLASGDFTVDAPLTLSHGLLVQAAGNITVSKALALQGPNELALNATGSLAIDAPVSVSGAGKVVLDAAYDSTTVPGTPLLELSFGKGDSIDYGATNNGGTLGINGTAYSLLYSMSDLAGINTNSALGGNYALATSLDATSTSGWAPLGTDGASNVYNTGQGFAGIFDGLGHTISNLTVNIGANADAGLFGYSSGTIRNVGVVARTVSSGNGRIGGLVGFNSGTIADSYTTGTVSGSVDVGGLVGVNHNGTIVNSYATGSVTAGLSVQAGGLVGENDGGKITNSYATGAVGGTSAIGGLVAWNLGGTISNSYATGVVSGNSHVGGLVGVNNGSISNGYWDTQTSGTATGLGHDTNAQTVTGLTTAQLQGTLPSGFGSSVWGTGVGLYPYFKWQYPTAPQAIGGIAYTSDGGAALSGGTVTALVNGNTIGSATTGANGYYYLLADPGTISGSGSAVLAYETGANSGARVDMLTGTATGFDVWGSTLIAPTTATTYTAASATSLQSQNTALIAQAVGSNTATANLVAGLTNFGYIASGNFTINAPLTLSNGLYVQAAGNITVNKAVTLQGATGLELNAGNGAIAINAPVSITGAGNVILDAKLVPVGCGCVSILDLSFGHGDSVDYGSTNNGGRLSINGDAYALLYNAADVQAVNASDTALQGNYALATAIDASAAPSWAPLGTDVSGGVANSGDGFTGNFEGLGNAISNLTVAVGPNNAGGLFGFTSGTVRDMQLVNVTVNGGINTAVGGLVGAQDGVVANVTVSGNVTGAGSSGGPAAAGGLVGFNTGFIVNSSSSAVVNGGDNAEVGGLVGFNFGDLIQSNASGAVTGGAGAEVGGLTGASNGDITQSYATGAATGGDNGAEVGGLVGANSGDIEKSYATGTVIAGNSHAYAGGLVGFNVGGISLSYATGAATAGNDRASVGGLAGQNDGLVSKSYATGAATAGDGSASVGGLVGQNAGSIEQSYATGAATGGNDGAWVGGLVGDNNGDIDQSYAMGAAHAGLNGTTDNASAGGLVGENEVFATIRESYSTGVASSSDAHGSVGGFVGNNDDITTAVDLTADYFDTQTSGTTLGIGTGIAASGVTGQTSAQLRGTLPTGFDNTVWGTGPRLYPYFLWQYPAAGGTPQAVSGTAYSNGGGTVLNAGTVSLLVDGNAEGSVSTGPNGFYYFLEAPGTISSGGSAVLVSTTQNATTGAADAASLISTTGSLINFDIWGNTFIAPTGAATYSSAIATSLQSQNTALIAQAVGSNASTATLVAGLSKYGYIAGGNFAIDTPLTLSNGLYVAAPGNITVGKPVTLQGANAIELNAGGALTINAPVSVTGAGHVIVDAAYDTTTVPGTPLLELSFGKGDSIDYGATDNGGTLTVNSLAYTLLYSMGDVQGINASNTALDGNYALATSLDATTTTGWVPIGTDSTGNHLNGFIGFAGVFEGLGHTVSNLTVDTGAHPGASLFGFSTGTIRDIGLVGESVTGNYDIGGLVGSGRGVVANAYSSGSVTGFTWVGGLIGQFSGAVVNSYSSSVMTGEIIPGSGSGGNPGPIGGLIGEFDGGTVISSHASGNVTAADGSEIGGLIGYAYSSTIAGAIVNNSYATGDVSATNGGDSIGGLIGLNYATVTNSYATGAVTGEIRVGGLIGLNYINGAVSNSYATGSVTGIVDPSSGLYATSIGGLIGTDQGAVATTNVYATGAVSGDSNVGGLIGDLENSLANAYSTGLVRGSGTNVGGLIGSDEFFGSITNAYWDKETSGITDPTAGAGNSPSDSGITAQTTSQLQGGVPAGFDPTVWGVVTGKSFPYLQWRFPTTPDVVSGTVFTAQGGSAVPGETVKTVVGGALVGTGSSGANGYYNVLLDGGTITPTGVVAYYQDGSHGGGTFEDGLTGAATGLDIYDNLRIITPDANLSTASGNFISTIGTQFGAGITTLNTFLSTIDSDLLVEANNGSGFSVDQTINGPETVAIKAAGNLTIAHGATVNGTGSGNAVVLSTVGNFVNSEGSDAIGVTGGGRWLVYSNAPGGDTFGALDSANAAIWNATVATLDPGSVTQTGNRYLFAYQPTLTITTSNRSKTYGDDATANVAAAYTVAGYQPGIARAFLGDNAASVYSGTPSVTSTGSVATAGVSGGPYAVVAATGSLAVLNGYAIAFQNTGALTVDPAHITVTALGGNSTYGSSPSNPGLSATGLQNGEDVSVLTGLSNSFGIVGTTSAGPHTLTVAGTNGDANYIVDNRIDGTWTVDPASLTITASDQSKTYGQTASLGTTAFTENGLVTANGDSITGVTLTSLGSVATANVTSSPYTITASSATGSGLSNYTIAYVGGLLTVDPAHITVTAVGGNSTYGSSPSNPGLSASGLQNGEDVSVLTGLSNSFGIVGTTSAGAHTLTVAGTNGDANYIVDNRIDGTWTVDPASLTITASDQSKTYGQTASLGTTAFTENGLVTANGDSITGVTLTSLGSVATANVTSSPYTITASSATGSGLSNYTIAYVGGLLTVDPAHITVTAVGGNSTYGSSPANPGLSASGLQNGEDVSVLTGLSNSFGIVGTTSAGAHTLTVAGTNGDANYIVDNRIDGTWTVDPASLTITASDQSKTYGQTASLGTTAFTENGLVTANGDSITGVTLTSLGSVATANVTSSPYTITASSATGSGLSNYTIAYVGGLLTVDPAHITVTALGGSSTYGSNPANPGLSASGLQNGEDVSVLTGLSNSFGIVGTTSAGAHTLTVAGTNGDANYIVDSTVDGTWTVNAAHLIVTALGGSSTYGSSPSNPGLSATGLQNGESVSVLTGLSNSFGIVSTTSAGAHTLSVLGTNGDANYIVDSTVDGTWTVNAAHLIVTALGGSSTYGSNPANPGLSASGLQNGEDVSVLTGLSNSFGIVGTTSAGAHTLSVLGTNGDANYIVDSTVDGTWTVNAAHLIVTALGGSSTYGSNPANPGLSASGLQNGEDVSVLTGLSNSFGIVGTTSAGAHTLSVLGTNGDANYIVDSTVDGTWTVNAAHLIVTALGGSSTYGSNPANPGLSASGLQNGEDVSVLTGLSNSFGIVGTTSAGPHTLTVAGTNGDANYIVDSTIDGTWTVNARPITVTADNLSRIYGTANPTLTYTVGGSGLVNGDTLSGLLTTSATASSGVGPYAIAQGTLAAGSNYLLSYVPGTLTINPATLTASLTGTVEKTYNGTTAATLTGSNYGLSGVVGSDVVTLNDPAPGTYDSKNVGTGKTVTVTGLAISGAGASNYVLASTSASGAVGVIDPATLTASLTGTVEKTYDGNTAAMLTSSNYSLAGVVSGDAVSLNDPASGLYDNKNAGTGKTVTVTGVALTGSGAGNYTLASNTLSGNVGLVDLAALSITADNISAPALAVANPTAHYSGFVNGENSSLVSGLQFGLFPVTGTSLQYNVVPFGASAPNYTITYFPGLLDAQSAGAKPIYRAADRQWRLWLAVHLRGDGQFWLDLFEQCCDRLDR